MTRPKPFDESKDPNPFWIGKYDDPFDVFAEPKGFMTDLIYYLRGTEVPSVYTIWTSLVIVSSVVKREAWLEWYPKEFFNNLYVILLGPSAGKKTTMIEIAIDLVDNYHRSIPDDNFRKMKSITVLKNKATPEAVLQTMKEAARARGVQFRDEDNNPTGYYKST